MPVIDRLDSARWKTIVAIIILTAFIEIMVLLGGGWFVYHSVTKSNQISKTTSDLALKQVPDLKARIITGQRIIDDQNHQIAIAITDIRLLQQTLTAHGIQPPAIILPTIPTTTTTSPASPTKESSSNSHPQAATVATTTTEVPHPPTTRPPPKAPTTTTTAPPLVQISIPAITIPA